MILKTMANDDYSLKAKVKQSLKMSNHVYLCSLLLDLLENKIPMIVQSCCQITYQGTNPPATVEMPCTNG